MDLFDGLLAGAVDGCAVVAFGFVALILLAALVSLLMEPAFLLALAVAGSAGLGVWVRRRHP